MTTAIYFEMFQKSNRGNKCGHKTHTFKSKVWVFVYLSNNSEHTKYREIVKPEQ